MAGICTAISDFSLILSHFQCAKASEPALVIRRVPCHSQRQQLSQLHNPINVWVRDFNLKGLHHLPQSLEAQGALQDPRHPEEKWQAFHYRELFWYWAIATMTVSNCKAAKICPSNIASTWVESHCIITQGPLVSRPNKCSKSYHGPWTLSSHFCCIHHNKQWKLSYLPIRRGQTSL